MCFGEFVADTEEAHGFWTWSESRKNISSVFCPHGTVATNYGQEISVKEEHQHTLWSENILVKHLLR